MPKWYALWVTIVVVTFLANFSIDKREMEFRTRVHQNETFTRTYKADAITATLWLLG